MEGTPLRRSPAPVILAAALAFVIASALRDQIRVDPGYASTLVRSLDVSLLYVVILLPGVIVGWLLRRRVLMWGFCAGMLGDILRQVITAWLRWSMLDVAPDTEVLGLDIQSLVSLVFMALPAGVISAAGGAVGYVLATRSNTTAGK